MEENEAEQAPPEEPTPPPPEEEDGSSYVSDYVDEEDDRIRVGWEVGNEEQLDWALKRRGELIAMQRANQRIFEAHVERMAHRLEKLNSPLEGGVAFLTGCIQTYVFNNRVRVIGSGKKKSRNLLHGTVGFRKTGGGLVVNDAAKLLAWARSQPVELGYVRITEAPALDEIKRLHKRTGELFPGTDLSPEVETFYAKSSEEKAHDDTDH